MLIAKYYRIRGLKCPMCASTDLLGSVRVHVGAISADYVTERLLGSQYLSITLVIFFSLKERKESLIFIVTKRLLIYISSL